MSGVRLLADETGEARDCRRTGQAARPLTAQRQITYPGQSASESSHNGPQRKPTSQIQPPNPPPCEPILTQRRRHCTTNQIPSSRHPLCEEILTHHAPSPYSHTDPRHRRPTVRANPHTTTPRVTRLTGPDHHIGHCASQSSHNAPQRRTTNRFQPPNPPSCERILTQRRRHSSHWHHCTVADGRTRPRQVI